MMGAIRVPYVLRIAAACSLSLLASCPPSAAGVEVERAVVYAEADGEELLLDVYQPADDAENASDAKRAAVLLIHGGGWRGGNREAPSMVALANALAEAGFVAFSIDYRLVKPAADGAGWLNEYPAAIDDCRAAVRWVRAHADDYHVDATRLGACGDSAGGHLVAMLGTSDAEGHDHSSRVEAVVDIFGPADLTSDYSDVKPGQLNVQELVDSFVSTPEKKREASPLFHIDDRTAAFLIFHGSDDQIVPVDQSRTFHAALQAAGATTEYIEFPGAGHGFAGDEWDTLVTRTIAFFDEQLRGEADSPVLNLGFEAGDLDQTPPDWFVPTEGWTGLLIDADADAGERAARLQLSGESQAPFGNLMCSVDATPYRERRVRLSAKIRLAAGANDGGKAMMWFRVDRANNQMGFFDNMADRPITADEWTDAVIEGDVDADATGFALGVMSVGGATVLIDDVRLETVRDVAMQPASPPQPLSPRGLENIQAATRLLAYVRFFHPSDAALAVDAWDHVAVHVIEQAEPATDAADLARRLEAAFSAIAPTLVVWAGEVDDAPPPAAPPEADALRYWSHLGAGRVVRQGSIYASQTVAAGLDGQPAAGPLDRLVDAATGAPPAAPPPSPIVDKPLGGGVACRLPVMVYTQGNASLPHSDGKNPWTSRAELPKLTTANRTTRLAAVASLWGVMQHFYPYFDVIETDWDAALPAALQAAAQGADDWTLLETLQELVAQLQDGHGNVYHPGLHRTHMLPLSLAWAEGDLVVAGKHDSAPADIAVGDVILAIDGQTVAERCAELSRRISAATDGWRRTHLLGLLSYAPPEQQVIPLRLRRADGAEYEAMVAPIELAEIPDATARRPANGAEVAPGIVYFDLNGAEAPALAEQQEKLAAAQGIVFDMRGYPGGGAVDLLTHLIDEPVTSAHWNIPLVTLPDRQAWEWNTSHWDLQPAEPRLTAPIAFLTDGRAISYAESIMGIVEHYQLGEIVGAATAGTNGNVNPFELPGGFVVSWTGMQVLKHDGSQHHGVGIKPTIPVEPTPAGIAAGRDEVLEAAVAALQQAVAAE